MPDVIIEVLEYLTVDGRRPYREWLHGLADREARARVRVRIRRIALGNFGDTKAVGGGVIEARIPYGPGYRIYFGRHGDQVVVLLCGGSKNTQVKDIALAQAYWEDCRRRKAWTR
jgi:putative addiction module killer protein